MKRLKDSFSLSVSSVMLDTIYSSYTVPYAVLRLQHDVLKLRQVLNRMVSDTSRVQSRILNSLYNLTSVLTKAKKQLKEDKLFPSYYDYSDSLAPLLPDHRFKAKSLSDSIQQMTLGASNGAESMGEEAHELSYHLSRILSSSSVVQGEVTNHYNNEQLSEIFNTTLNFCSEMLNYLRPKLSPYLQHQVDFNPEFFRYSCERVESLVDYGCKMIIFGDRLPADFIIHARNHPDWKSIYLAVSEFFDGDDPSFIDKTNGELAFKLFSKYSDVHKSLMHPILISEEFSELLSSHTKESDASFISHRKTQE